ncbi:MAG: (d)CMP kinase [Planctomycetota bacterium]
MERLIVTLDGPAGSGKSTVARRLAERLGVEFLDTGAMYRGLTALALHRGLRPAEDEDASLIVELARANPLRFDWTQDPPRLLMGSVDLSSRLRDSDVSQNVSDVARLVGVRRVLVDRQRDIGREHPRLVSEGRDQGSVVFPEADAKFFLDASTDVRAKRRAGQIRAAGRVAHEPEIRRRILERDRKDSTREFAPLICPQDAERIDTSDMTLGAVVDHLEGLVTQRGLA